MVDIGLRFSFQINDVVQLCSTFFKNPSTSVDIDEKLSCVQEYSPLVVEGNESNYGRLLTSPQKSLANGVAPFLILTASRQFLLSTPFVNQQLETVCTPEDPSILKLLHFTSTAVPVRLYSSEQVYSTPACNYHRHIPDFKDLLELHLPDFIKLNVSVRSISPHIHPNSQ